MFRKPAPESQEAQNDVVALANAIAALTPEQMQLRCESYSAQQLKALITDIENLIAIPAKIFAYFRTHVGYSSDDAIRNGIQAHASGKVREMRNQLFGVEIPEFLRMAEVIDGMQTGAPSQKKSYAKTPEEEQEAQEAERISSMNEEIAKRYLAMNSAKPALEKHLIMLRAADASLQQTAMPSKKTTKASK